MVSTNAIKFANPQQDDTIVKAIRVGTPDQPGYLSLRAALLNQDNQLRLLDPAARLQFIDETLPTLANNDDFRSKVFFLTQRADQSTSVDDLLQHAIYTPSNRLLAIYPALTTQQPPLYF